MNRTQFQQLTDERVLDAQSLLNAGRWSGAYYLAGYSVECALKACIAKLTNQHDFPDKEFVNQCYTHKIERLMILAGLEAQLKVDAIADALLANHWKVVIAWDERARYQHWTEPKAREILSAVLTPVHGVLPWIKVRW